MKVLIASAAVAVALAGCATNDNHGMSGLTPSECAVDFVGALTPFDRAATSLVVGQPLQLFFTVRPQPVVVAQQNDSEEEVGLIDAGENLSRMQACTNAGGHYRAEVVSLSPYQVRVRELGV